MLYVREFSFENYIMFTQLISLLLPCLKYCICPTFFLHTPPFCQCTFTQEPIGMSF